MGSAVSLAGGWLIAYRGLVQKIGGILIILFGLHLIGVLRIPFLMRRLQLPLSSKPAGVLGSVLTLAGTAQTVGDGNGCSSACDQG